MIDAAVAGTGPAVVLEMGAGSGGIGRWGQLERDLASAGTVVTYDRRLVGPSIAAWADDLATVIAEHAEDGRAVVVGWSLGAAIAVGAAIRHPGAVAGLVLVDPFVPMEGSAVRTAYRLLSPVSAAVTRAAGAVPTLARRALASTGLTPEHELWPVLYDGFRSAEGRRVLRHETRQLLRTSDEYVGLIDDGPIPDIPVVVLSATERGRQRRMAPMIRKSHEGLTARFPRGTLVEASGCTHHLPLLRPDLVVDAVHLVRTP